MNKALILPAVLIPFFSILVGVMAIPEIADRQEPIPIVEAEVSCRDKVACEKLDQILENQEFIKDQLIDIYDLNS